MNSIYIKQIKRKYFFTDKGLSFAKEKLEEGDSYKNIAKIMDINPDTLGQLCKRYNIAKDNRRKYTLNKNYFKKIDTPEKAYWLGFIAADGAISEDRGRIDIALQPSDKEHLNKFLKAIGSNQEPHSGASQKGKYPNVYVHICGKEMIEDLVKLGCHQNKSLNLLYPTEKQVPKELQKYWILGYYDGDGGISIYNSENRKRYKSYFTGTFEVLTGILEYLKYDNAISKEHRCTNNTYRISFTEGKTDEFLSKMYDDYSTKFCLERKYNKFIEAFNARNIK